MGRFLNRDKKEPEKQKKEITTGACLRCYGTIEGEKIFCDDTCSIGYLMAQDKSVNCTGYKSRENQPK